MRICLDAGHGGNDPGAVGPTKLTESEVNLDVCKRLASFLTAHGMTTCQTRVQVDEFVELHKRATIANEFHAEYFISVHCNSDGPSAYGVETLYKSSTGEQLAGHVQRALVEATHDRDRGLKHRSDLAVLNSTSMPAILVEIGFISHPPTESELRDVSHRQLIAKAIAQGLFSFLGTTMHEKT